MEETEVSRRMTTRASNQAVIVCISLFVLFALFKAAGILTEGGPTALPLGTLLAVGLVTAAFIRADYFRSKPSEVPMIDLITRNLGAGLGAGIMLGMFPPAYLVAFPLVLFTLCGIALLVAKRPPR